MNKDRSCALAMSLAMSIGICAPAWGGESEKAAEETDEIRVMQFYGGQGVPFAAGTPDEFSVAVKSACRVDPLGTKIAPIFAALGGIIVDWLFKSALSNLSARMQKYLAEFTASYSNELKYGDLLAEGRWDKTKTFSCVVAQRVVCPAVVVNDQSDSCKKGAATSSVAFRLKREGVALYVEPIAFSVGAMKAKHSKGKLALAFSTRIHAIRAGHGRSGEPWNSGEVVFASEKFEATGNAFTKPLQKDYKLPLDSLGKAPKILPMFPTLSCGDKSLGAIQVTFAEVGEPKRHAKRFATFLADNKDSVSGALSDAAKKKLGLKE